jgi:hypothetical protein
VRARARTIARGSRGFKRPMPFGGPQRARRQTSGSPGGHRGQRFVRRGCAPSLCEGSLQVALWRPIMSGPCRQLTSPTTSLPQSWRPSVASSPAIDIPTPRVSIRCARPWRGSTRRRSQPRNRRPRRQPKTPRRRSDNGPRWQGRRSSAAPRPQGSGSRLGPKRRRGPL